ncbi:MAG: 3'(2'),5'-bisphosphate nucleotidase CysQ [Parcubacteria group bacterium]|jgi:3'(2'), 5'-bisphosphate nucleotidase
MHNVNIENIISIAKEAGKIAMSFYDKPYSIAEKKNKTPITEVDQALHDYLMKELSVYGYPILSEEGEDDFEKRKNAEFVWIIDPLDGTSDFIQKTGEFAVMIGLVNNGGESILGVVYAPALDELYFAQKGEGAYMMKDGEKTKLTVSDRELEKGRILVSRNHLGEFEQEIAKKHHMQQISMGSAGLKMCRIAKRDAELYINSSDQSGVWDICAGDVIIKEAGGRIVDLNKDIILYDKQVILKSGCIVL